MEFLMYVQNWIIVLPVIQIDLFSPWYSFKIAELSLNNNHSHIILYIYIYIISLYIDINSYIAYLISVSFYMFVQYGLVSDS
jgi:uncharacterized protein YqhQ